MSHSMRDKYFTEISATLAGIASIREVREKGVGIVAETDIEEGTLLWTEKPLYSSIARQLPDGEYSDLACEACGSYCGTLQLQLKLFGGSVSYTEACKTLASGEDSEIKELMKKPALPGVSEVDCILTDGAPLVLAVGDGHVVFCGQSCRKGWEDANKSLLKDGKLQKVRHLVAQWYPLPIFLLWVPLQSNQPRKRCPSL